MARKRGYPKGRPRGPLSDEHRRKLVEAWERRRREGTAAMSEEQKAKLREAFVGKPLSKAHRRRIAAGMRRYRAAQRVRV
jgi:hypothetical protein